MATINCPECSGNLEVVNDDLRQEWERITYYCLKCKKEYSRLITFKCQSSLVESDEWENEKSEKPVIKDKISHWIVMMGTPVYAGKNRQLARNKVKDLQSIKEKGFLYIGKVIDDPKRRGHGKIVLEY